MEVNVLLVLFLTVPFGDTVHLMKPDSMKTRLEGTGKYWNEFLENLFKSRKHTVVRDTGSQNKSIHSFSNGTEVVGTEPGDKETLTITDGPNSTSLRGTANQTIHELGAPTARKLIQWNNAILSHLTMSKTGQVNISGNFETTSLPSNKHVDSYKNYSYLSNQAILTQNLEKALGKTSEKLNQPANSDTNLTIENVLPSTKTATKSKSNSTKADVLHGNTHHEVTKMSTLLRAADKLESKTLVSGEVQTRSFGPVSFPQIGDTSGVEPLTPATNHVTERQGKLNLVLVLSLKTTELSRCKKACVYV